MSKILIIMLLAGAVYFGGRSRDGGEAGVNIVYAVICILIAALIFILF